MEYVYIILGILALAWIFIWISTSKAPVHIQLWHPMTLLMDADPVTRADVLRRYPEVTESWLSHDSASDFLRKYPDTVERMYGTRYEPVELTPAKSTLKKFRTILTRRRAERMLIDDES